VVGIEAGVGETQRHGQLDGGAPRQRQPAVAVGGAIDGDGVGQVLAAAPAILQEQTGPVGLVPVALALALEDRGHPHLGPHRGAVAPGPSREGGRQLEEQLAALARAILQAAHQPHLQHPFARALRAPLLGGAGQREGGVGQVQRQLVGGGRWRCQRGEDQQDRPASRVLVGGHRLTQC
jgi:hypothetical protein